MLWTTQWFALTDAQRTALPTERIDSLVSTAALFLVDYKFYTLFSMLFGLGFALQIARAAERGRRILPVYMRRLLILLVIGLAHGLLLWFGNILQLYALIGFVLILFRNRSDKTLVVWALALR